MQIEKLEEPYLSKISKAWPMSFVCLLFLVKMYFDRPDIFPFLFLLVGTLLGLFLLVDKVVNNSTGSKGLTLTDDSIVLDGADLPYRDIVKVEDKYGFLLVYSKSRKPLKLRKSEYPIKELCLGVSLINERAGLSA